MAAAVYAFVGSNIAAAGTAQFTCPEDAGGSCAFAIFSADGEAQTFSLQPGSSGWVDAEPGDRFCSATTGTGLDLESCPRSLIRGIRETEAAAGAAPAARAGANRSAMGTRETPAVQPGPAVNRRPPGAPVTSRSVMPRDVGAGVEPGAHLRAAPAVTTTQQ